MSAGDAAAASVPFAVVVAGTFGRAPGTAVPVGTGIAGLPDAGFCCFGSVSTFAEESAGGAAWAVVWPSDVPFCETWSLCRRRRACAVPCLGCLIRTGGRGLGRRAREVARGRCGAAAMDGTREMILEACARPPETLRRLGQRTEPQPVAARRTLWLASLVSQGMVGQSKRRANRIRAEFPAGGPSASAGAAMRQEMPGQPCPVGGLGHSRHAQTLPSSVGTGLAHFMRCGSASLSNGEAKMSIFGAMNTAMSGLNAQSDAFGNISDNVANSTTIGYKQVGTNFSDYLTTSTARAE